MKNILLISYFCMLCIGFCSCTNEEQNFSIKTEMQSRSLNEADLRVYAFPHVDEILKSAVIQKKMEETWNLMKSSYKGTTRREYSFFIYYDQSSKTYWTDETPTPGDTVSGCIGTHASVKMGIPSDNTQCCAFFHCHTPLTNCPSTVSRETIASVKDIEWADKNKLPGILFDYDMNPLRGGHDINLAHKTIKFGKYKQRPSIGFNIKTKEYIPIDQIIK